MYNLIVFWFVAIVFFILPAIILFTEGFWEWYSTRAQREKEAFQNNLREVLAHYMTDAPVKKSLPSDPKYLYAISSLAGTDQFTESRTEPQV